MGVTANSLSTGSAGDITSTSTAGGASGTSKLLNLARSGANANLAHTAYGIYSSVTNTNATSGTNIGGYFTASGATTANYGLIVDAGNVGIGDTSPSSKLEVGDGTDSLQISSVGDLTFVDADGAASITGPAGGALSVVAGASQPLTLTANLGSTWSTSSGALTLTSAAAATWSTTDGLLSLTGNDGITLNASTTAGITGNVPDAIANAFDLQQGSDNYINIATSDGTENISFGNATTNPTFGFLGTGLITVAGAGAETASLTLTTGTVTLTDGDLTLSS